MYKKYTTPCPHMGCGVVERHLEMAQPTKKDNYFKWSNWDKNDKRECFERIDESPSRSISKLKERKCAIHFSCVISFCIFTAAKKATLVNLHPTQVELQVLKQFWLMTNWERASEQHHTGPNDAWGWGQYYKAFLIPTPNLVAFFLGQQSSQTLT